jgi:hypothetical protein
MLVVNNLARHGGIKQILTMHISARSQLLWTCHKGQGILWWKWWMSRQLRFARRNVSTTHGCWICCKITLAYSEHFVTSSCWTHPPATTPQISIQPVSGGLLGCSSERSWLCNTGHFLSNFEWIAILWSATKKHVVSLHAPSLMTD